MRKKPFRYLTFVGPRYYRVHPVTQPAPCSFLSIGFPKLVAVGGQHGQLSALDRATTQ